MAESRLHFTSAMTQLGYYDGDYEASYLELAQFLTEHGANTKEDLARCGAASCSTSPFPTPMTTSATTASSTIRRLVVIAAYDINPVTPAHGLHLNITDSDNRLDYELAMDVIEFFS